MQEPELVNGSYLINIQYEKMKKLQKLKNSLITVLAGYVASTTSKDQVITSLAQIKASTCNVVSTTGNGAVIPGDAKFNRDCSC